jgi:cytochrome c oxidase subunit 2
MFYAVIVYRRRKGDTSMPRQFRYNNPIETLFTVVPLIMVIGFFAFTAKTMTAIETPVDSDVKIQVIAKQWSWDFNYVTDNAHESGIQGIGVTAEDEKALPTLWLPVNKSVEISLTSRDVIHSFWVVEFLYKKDMFPASTNKMYFTPTQIGEYSGKCAELCGEYHSMMLFNVKVVSRAEFDSQMAALAAKGNTGQLDSSYDRNLNLPGNGSDSKG